MPPRGRRSRFWRRLRAFNTLSLSVFSVFGIILAGFMLAMMVEDFVASSRQDGQRVALFDSSSNGYDQGLTAEKLETPDGPLILYKHGSSDVERDLRFVQPRDGSVFKFAAGYEGAIAQGQLLSQPDNEGKEIGAGYIGLGSAAQLRSDRSGKKPVFDLVVMRFIDMKTFVLAKSLTALDSVTPVGEGVYSVILTDAGGRTEFAVFDLVQGRLTVRREIDLGGQRSQSPTDSESAAPRNKFH